MSSEAEGPTTGIANHSTDDVFIRGKSLCRELIGQRSEGMVRSGLLDEVRGLASRGYSLDLPPLKSVGYRQMGAVLRGEASLAEALEEMKRETRHLAKRQLTWFRRDASILWFHPERERSEIFDAAARFLG